MHNTVLVAKHEIRTTLAKRSFWFTTFLLPLLIIAFTLIPQMLASSAANGNASTAGGMASPQALGYVDQAGLIADLPPGPSSDRLMTFPDEPAAQTALQAGEIGLYYVIPAEFMASGELVLVSDQLAPLDGPDTSRAMELLINYNLVGDEALARLLVNPTPRVASRSLLPQLEGEQAPEGPLGFGIPFVVMFILFFTITMSASYMLQSVVKEKENRTAEVLLLSLRPEDLMLGKVIGLGMVALLQMAIWMGGGFLVMGRGMADAVAGAGPSLPPGFLAWTLLYFLLGYLVYSSALGALGALAPNLREGSQFTFIFLLPLLVPLWLIQVFVQDPNGTAATILSLFPLTAPSVMVTRLASGDVPPWQPVVGLVLLAATAYLFVRLAARFFRADTLLSERSLSWARLVGEVRGGG